MKLNIKKLDPAAIVPTYAHPGDAGMDIYAFSRTVLKPGIVIDVDTRISMEIPDGYVGLIWDKSGLAVKYSLKVMGGVIDAGYRGEIRVGIINLGPAEYVLEAGHKVAQILVQKIEHPTIEVVTELSDTSRGHGRFGSTGK